VQGRGIYIPKKPECKARMTSMADKFEAVHVRGIHEIRVIRGLSLCRGFTTPASGTRL
jgi:hypothetical protein